MDTNIDIDINKLVNEIYDLAKLWSRETLEERNEDLKELKEIVENVLKLIEDAKNKKVYLRLNDNAFKGFPMDDVLGRFPKDEAMWVSPSNLENEIKKGNLLYTSDSWELRNPVERIAELQDEIMDKQKELKKFTREVAKYTSEKKE